MEQTLKEKSLEHETNGDAAQTHIQIAPTETLDERMLLALKAASDKKAVNLVLLNLYEVADFTEFFLITNGTNTRQVQAISDGIADELRNQGTRPVRIEGYNSAEWILMDYGDFVVHIFEEKAREFYDLERLWRDAKRVQIPEGI